MDLPAKQGRNSEAYIKNLARVGAKYATAREGFEKQQDLLKAFQFYNQAAQYGHPGSNYELGIMYESGVPGSGGFAVEKDLAKAIKFYKVAADGGMASAKFNLGLMLESGRGVPEDQEGAMTLFEEAAELGHAKALCLLAERYFVGIRIDEATGAIVGTVGQDFRKALEYWGQAAELDHPKSIHALSVMYEYGIGVEQSEARASMLHDLAAFCFVQQARPAHGQTGGVGGSGGVHVELPAWLTEGKARLPAWKQRKFVAAKRQPPPVESRQGGLGPGRDFRISQGGDPDSPRRSFSSPPRSASESASPGGSARPGFLRRLDRAEVAFRPKTEAKAEEEAKAEARAKEARRRAEVEHQAAKKEVARRAASSAFSLNYADRKHLPHRNRDMGLNMTQAPKGDPEGDPEGGDASPEKEAPEAGPVMSHPTARLTGNRRRIVLAVSGEADSSPPPPSSGLELSKEEEVEADFEDGVVSTPEYWTGPPSKPGTPLRGGKDDQSPAAASGKFPKIAFIGPGYC